MPPAEAGGRTRSPRGRPPARGRRGGSGPRRRAGAGAAHHRAGVDPRAADRHRADQGGRLRGHRGRPVLPRRPGSRTPSRHHHRAGRRGPGAHRDGLRPVHGALRGPARPQALRGGGTADRHARGAAGRRFGALPADLRSPAPRGGRRGGLRPHRARGHRRRDLAELPDPGEGQRRLRGRDPGRVRGGLRPGAVRVPLPRSGRLPPAGGRVPGGGPGVPALRGPRAPAAGDPAVDAAAGRRRTGAHPQLPARLDRHLRAARRLRVQPRLPPPPRTGRRARGWCITSIPG